MTVPKLVAIILAVVVLVFLVFGATQLKPLYNRVGVMFDNVLYFFGLGDGEDRGDCTELAFSIYGSDGEKFLDDMGVPSGERENVFFEICDDGSCGVGPISKKEYRISDGRFEFSYGGENWASQEDYLFRRSAEDTKRDWEVYHGVLDWMEDKIGEDEFRRVYDSRITGSFELWGDSAGIFDVKEKRLIWRNGEWSPDVIMALSYETPKFLENFYHSVIDGFNDDVYFREGIPIIGDKEYIGSEGSPAKIFEESKTFIPFFVKNNEIYRGGQGTNIELDKQEDGSYLLEYGALNRNVGTIVGGEITSTVGSPLWYFDTQLKKTLSELEVNYTFDGRIFNKKNSEEKTLEVGSWYPINQLIDSDNYKLDKQTELDSLIKEVEDIIYRLTIEADISDEELEKLEEEINGEKITICGVNYAMKIQKDLLEYPQIALTAGETKYWFKFSSDVDALREMGVDGVHLRYYQLELTHNGDIDDQPQEIDYKLPKDEWNKFYELNLIEDFIREKCR